MKARKGRADLTLSAVKLNLAPLRAPGKGADDKLTSAEGNVYAFNAEGGGFAVVCTGSGNTAVAGYSDSGSIDAGNMPEAMSKWLQQYQSAMASASSSALDTYGPTWNGPTVTPVAPLIKTEWGQGAPFNSKCPSNGKQTAQAGCVPVALAQVLNFYHQDRKGGGSLYYSHLDSETEYDIDYSTTTYDWGNMLNKYDANATQAQKDAVGKLMLECGVASKAQYGYESTGAPIPFVALNKYYNFDCMFVSRQYSYTWDMFTVSNYYIPTAKWMKMIQDELEAGRPIIYSADDTDGQAGEVYIDPTTEHCFIIDGIDDKNFVHVNWGWAGNADGYYDVAILNPGIKFNYEQGFRGSHSMILGIKPREGDYREALYQSFIPYDWVTSRGDAVKSKENDGALFAPAPDRSAESIVTSYSRMYFHLISNSYEDKEMTFTTVLMRKDGGKVKILPNGHYKQPQKGWPNVNRWNLKQGFTQVPTDVPDGIYEVRTEYVDDEGSHLCPMPEQLIPTMEIVNNGTGMILHGLEGDSIDDKLTIEDVSPASEVYAGTSFYLYLTGHGAGISSSLQFRNVETGKVYGAYSGAKYFNSFGFKHIYDDYTSKEIFKFLPKNVDNGFSMPAGRYKVEVPENQTGVVLAKDFYIDVAEMPSYPVLDGTDKLFAYYSQYDGKKVQADGYHTLPNNYYLVDALPSYSYANKTEDDMTLKVYMINKDTGEKNLIKMMSGWTPQVRVPLKCSTYPLTGNYEFRCTYVTRDGKEHTGLMPAEYYEDKPTYYYRIVDGDASKLLLCDFVSAEIIGAPASLGANAIGGGMKLTIKPHDAERNYNAYPCGVRALFFDETLNEVYAYGVPDVKLTKGENTEVLINPRNLTRGSEYTVLIHLNDLPSANDPNDGRFTSLLNPDGSVAALRLNGSGLATGIGSPVAANAAMGFAVGEKVAVYDAAGNVCRSLQYTDGLWSEIAASLPKGMYIVKSAAKSVKFYNR